MAFSLLLVPSNSLRNQRINTTSY